MRDLPHLPVVKLLVTGVETPFARHMPGFFRQEIKMTIPNHARANFHTLLRAAADGNLALMECLDSRTSEPRYVLCAVGHDGTDRVFTPFGHLADGDPYDAYLPPDPDNPRGFLTTGQARSDGRSPATDDRGESNADQA